ncbi:hypothetical protein ACF1AJ_20515 [Leifsonia sp. NPDC014704]|uniref:hypothetical protein n=1 Tax=Leifsonia sp. NPDC014704 TaxID=3364123 RepID=UPI0036F475A6
MNFWETVGATVVAFLFTGLIGWAASLAWKAIRDWSSRERPDFILTYAHQQWTLRRARRSVAYAVEGHIWRAGEAVLPHPGERWFPFVDDADERTTASFELQRGDTLDLTWVDGSRRSASLDVVGDAREYPIVAAPQPRKRWRRV